MQRYFVSEPYWSDGKVTLVEDAHHIIRVMRFTLNDMILCIHPNGDVAQCEIVEINKENTEVKASIIKWLDDDKELPVNVTILQSLPKGNKLDFILQKGTELGANQFLLFQSKRSIVKWDAKRIQNRLQRYKKITKEASEQSGRTVIPEVHYVEHLPSYIETIDSNRTIKLIAYEEETKRRTSSSLYKQLLTVNKNEHIIVCIGPEGGFSDDEVSFLKSNQFHPVRLGKRILRTETAALYALASISYHFEEMECE